MSACCGHGQDAHGDRVIAACVGGMEGVDFSKKRIPGGFTERYYFWTGKDGQVALLGCECEGWRP